MTTYYLESSALAKVYHDEPGTESVERLLGSPGDRFHVSSLCLVEVHSTSARRVRERSLTRADAVEIATNLATDVRNGRYHVHPLPDSRLTRASEILLDVGTRRPLRALDALHLAAALAILDDAPDLVLVTADARLTAAAADLGVATLDPTRA